MSEEELEEELLPTWIYVTMVAVMTLAFFGLYLVVTYLPFWVFVSIHTVVGIITTWILYKRKEISWAILVLAYTTTVLFFMFIQIVRLYGLRITGLFIMDIIFAVDLLISFTVFIQGLPLYILSFAVLVFAFIWSVITRRKIMFNAMKGISMILLIVAFVQVFIFGFEAIFKTYDILLPYTLFTMVGTFMSGYTFVLMFLGGIIEGLGG